MIAKEYGQDPRSVAEWGPDWIAAALTVLGATSGAATEKRTRDERRARAQHARGAL